MPEVTRRQAQAARDAQASREQAAPNIVDAATPTKAAQALALQRTAGNRATARVLSRWAAHPDKDKKGALVPDGVASEYMRFNPPANQ